MHRRGFLKTTFASGLAVSGSACAGTKEQVASTPPLPDRELEHKLERLDKTLARLNHEATKRWFLREHEAELSQLEPGKQGEQSAKQLQRHLTHEGELLCASMRTALLVSTVAELPEQNQHDPRVAERVMQGSDEADYALFGNLELLRNLSPEQLADLDAELTSEAAPGMDIASRLDALSAEIGVPTRRRLHLRRMAMHIDWRLQQERISSVIADVVGQIDRMVDSIGRGNAGQLALVGPDPAWATRTREIVAFYGSPPPPDASTPAPTDAPPVAESTAPTPPAALPPPPTLPPPAQDPPTPAPNPRHTAAKRPETDDEWEEWARQRRKQQQASTPTLTSTSRQKLEKKVSKGQTMLGVGAGMLVVGGIAAGIGLGVGLSSGGAGLFVLAGIGAVAVTVGIILLIVGAVVAGKARRKLKGL